MIVKKTKKIVISIILTTLLFIGLPSLLCIGLIYLDNYFTPRLGSCYDNRNRIPHSHVGPCNNDGENW